MPNNTLAHELTMLILNGKLTLNDLPKFIQNYKDIYFKVTNYIETFNK